MSTKYTIDLSQETPLSSQGFVGTLNAQTFGTYQSQYRGYKCNDISLSFDVPAGSESSPAILMLRVGYDQKKPWISISCNQGYSVVENLEVPLSSSPASSGAGYKTISFAIMSRYLKSGTNSIKIDCNDTPFLCNSIGLRLGLQSVAPVREKGQENIVVTAGIRGTEEDCSVTLSIGDVTLSAESVIENHLGDDYPDMYTEWVVNDFYHQGKLYNVFEDGSSALYGYPWTRMDAVGSSLGGIFVRMDNPQGNGEQQLHFCIGAKSADGTGWKPKDCDPIAVTDQGGSTGQ